MQVNEKLLELSERSDPPNGEHTPAYVYAFECLNQSRSIILHWQNEFEIILCLLKGYAEINGRYLELNPGDLLLVNPGELHTVYSQSGGRLQILVCDYNALIPRQYGRCQELLTNLQDGVERLENLIPKDHPANGALAGCLQELMAASQQAGPAKELRTVGLLYRLIAILFDEGIARRQERSANPHSTQAKTVKSIISYINHQYAEPITIERLAEEVNLNRHYMIRLFRQFTNMTPMEYLIQTRIHASLPLLANNTVTSAGFEVGFNNVSYYIRTFRKWMGKTPRAYKKGVGIPASDGSNEHV